MAPVAALGDGRYSVVRVKDGNAERAAKPLACPACGQQGFDARAGVLDTRGASFFGVTWANRGSTELICRTCQYVLTFADPA